jgi:hypothetical protein
MTLWPALSTEYIDDPVFAPVGVAPADLPCVASPPDRTAFLEDSAISTVDRVEWRIL